MSLQRPTGIWLAGLDADYWKSWLHERFLTPEQSPAGRMTLFGSDKRRHLTFAHHICAEVEVEEFVEGKGLKRYWKKVNRNNHWLDTLYMSCVAASLHGMRLVQVQQPIAARGGLVKRTGGQRFLDRPGGWIKGMR